MKCVVLGDIGWHDMYHLGDEAMTEAAVQMLRKRGVVEITLIAGEPNAASARYGVHAVQQLGFRLNLGRDECEAKLASLCAELAALEGEWENHVNAELFTAIQQADFVLIAGGGNLTTQYFGHLYERVALARIARHLDVPVCVTSQTVGPMFRDSDAELMREIIASSVAFGTREETSAELLRQLSGQAEHISLVDDDALLLTPTEQDRRVAQDLNLGERVIAASFTSDPGESGLSRDEYFTLIAEVLDELAERFDANVALIPHTGSFQRVRNNLDQGSNLKIMERSRTGRLIATKMLTSREYIAVLERALLSLSSRYHPVVFAPMIAVPTVAVSLSYYSSVRMRGVMAHSGLHRYVVPSSAWNQIVPACVDAVSTQGEAREDLLLFARQRVTAQENWWDGLLAGTQRSGWNAHRDVALPEPLVARGRWSELVEGVTPLFEQLGQVRTYLEWTKQENLALNRASKNDGRELARLRKQIRELEDRAVRAESRRTVRIMDRLAVVFGRC